MFKQQYRNDTHTHTHTHMYHSNNPYFRAYNPPEIDNTLDPIGHIFNAVLALSSA